MTIIVIIVIMIKSDLSQYDNADDDNCHIRSLAFMLQGPQVKIWCYLLCLNFLMI